MTLRVTTRADISLDAVRRVAWDGEGVELAPETLARIDDCHDAFAALVAARLVEDPGALIYGTTTAPGDGAAVPLTREAHARRPTRPRTAPAFGNAPPERARPAIVLARPRNLLAGHAAVPRPGAPPGAAVLDRPPP